MAYFSNGTEGEVFDLECSTCKYGQEACLIAFVQFEYNYKACNNEVARAILDELIKQDGTCEMKRIFKNDFCTDAQQPKIDFNQK